KHARAIQSTNSRFDRDRRWCSTEKKSASGPPGRLYCSETGFFRFEIGRLGTFAVDVFVEHCVPAGGKIICQFVASAYVVERETAWHDEQVFVVVLPKTIDYFGHQLQYAARSLKSVDCRPVFIKAIENFRMYWVGFQHALEIAGLLRLRWQTRSLRDIGIG